MRNTLVIRAGRDPDAPCHWLPLNSDGQATGVVRSGSLAEAAIEANGQRVVALMSGIDCLLTEASVPGRANRQKVLRAVPFVLEEQLSDDVEELHFALGPALDAGRYPVAVISIERMNAILDAFRAAGIEVAQLLPDLLAVPWQAGHTCILVDGDMALVRTGSCSGYAVDVDNLGLFFGDREAADETGAMEQAAVRLYVAAGGEVPDLPVTDVEVEYYSGDALALLVQGLGSVPIDLLQGAYSRTQEWGRIWRPWRVTAALLLAGILLSNVAMGIDYYRLGRVQESLNAQLEEIYRQVFPEAKRVVNPGVQMQQQLDQLQRRKGGGGQFMELLARSGDVLRKAKDIELSGASYRAGRLDVDLTATSLQALDELKQTLAKKGLVVEIQSATTEAGQRVKSRLRIQGEEA